MPGFRPTLIPTLFTVPALLVLVALGVWQVERLAWKTRLIDTIDSRIHADPVPLPPLGALDPNQWEYRRVIVRGVLRNDKEMHLLAYTERGNLGYHLIVPLIPLARDGAGAVLVDRGWVPAAQKAPASRPQSQPEGVVNIEGVVRKPWGRGWFVPENDPAENLWFYPDVAAMAASAGVAVPPLLIEAGPAPNPGGLPIGGQTVVDVPNHHLQYALTWFGFAIALAVIYVLYHRRLEDERSRQGEEKLP
ncbi:MAG TPA: SURF1 family protein [Candidatus Cybelea sp.]|nr:SURF1 family protein [Candidatus Cybelea sp.]